MKINFDYYTNNTNFAIEAYKLAVAEAAAVTLNYDVEDNYHCINGTIDHSQLDELFNYFEECGFVEHWSDL